MILTIIISNIILIAKHQIMNEFCYLDEEQNRIILNFDSRLPFVPEDLEIYYESFARSHDSRVVSLGRKSVHLTKTDGECHPALNYEVPATTDPIIIIDIAMLWGNTRFVIDKFGVVLKSNFEDNIHNLGGLLRNSDIKILLRRQTSINPLSAFRPLPYRIINWNREVRALKSEELLCLSFFTKEYSDILVLSNPPKGYQKTKYSTLKFVTHSNKNLKLLDEKKYLTQVYPCVLSDVENKRLKIFVDPDTFFIDLEMPWSSLGRLISRYFVSDGTLKKSHTFHDMDFEYLDVIRTPLIRSMVSEDVGILLYGHNVAKRECPATPWEREYGFRLGFSLEKKVGVVVVEKYRQILASHYGSLDSYHLTRI